MKIRSLKALKNFLNERVKKTLKDKVANEVKKSMIEHIWEEVYDVYDPIVYVRRYENEGIGDINKIQVDTINSGYGISMWNKAKKNNYYTHEYLAPLIEYGWKGATAGSPRYKQKRPFIEATRNELIKDKYHIRMFKNEFKSWGFKVK